MKFMIMLIMRKVCVIILYSVIKFLYLIIVCSEICVWKNELNIKDFLNM